MLLSPSQSKICFFFQETSFGLQNRAILKKFIESIFKKERRTLESLNYVFCTDKVLLGINREYLAHNEYTDIITFELSDKGQPVLGEIYISIDRVRENSVIHKTTFKSEFHRVVFHGALHLCGYTDKTTKDRDRMRLKEDFYLNLYI